MAKKQEYGNESITSLKGADRVRKRPAVIFGSDGVEGCAHSIFEIVSNSIDEARDGHGDTINVTRCKDGSVIVEDLHFLEISTSMIMYIGICWWQIIIIPRKAASIAEKKIRNFYLKNWAS